MVEPTNDRGSISTIGPTQQGGSSLHIFRIFPSFFSRFPRWTQWRLLIKVGLLCIYFGAGCSWGLNRLKKTARHIQIFGWGIFRTFSESSTRKGSIDSNNSFLLSMSERQRDNIVKLVFADDDSNDPPFHFKFTSSSKNEMMMMLKRCKKTNEPSH